MFKVSLRKVTYLLLIACLLGVNFFSINLGAFQLSLYRMLIIFSPLLFDKIIINISRLIKEGSGLGYVKYLIFWISYSVISVIWVTDYEAWLKTLSFLITGSIISIFIFTFIKTTTDLVISLKIVEFFGIAYGLLSLYEIFTGTYFFVVEKNLEYFTERSLALSVFGFREPVAVFGNPNDLAIFLFFSVVSSLALIRIKRDFFPKLLSAFVIGNSIFLILCTQSRSVFLGICIFFGLVFLFKFLKFSLSKKFRYSFIFVIIAFLLYYFIGQNEVIVDLTTVNLSNPDEGSSDSIRKNLIINGLYYLIQTFGFGVGLGNIEYYNNYRPFLDVGNVGNIHNWWMEILVSSGIIIFIVYIIVYTKAMLRLLVTFRNTLDYQIKQLSLPFACFFLPFIVVAVGSSTLMGSEWIWPLVALVLKSSHILYEEKKSG